MPHLVIDGEWLSEQRDYCWQLAESLKGSEGERIYAGIGIGYERARQAATPVPTVAEVVAAVRDEIGVPADGADPRDMEFRRGEQSALDAVLAKAREMEGNADG